MYGRNQLLLDLTKPEVRDNIVENVSNILNSTEISYVKWDMNRHSAAPHAQTLRATPLSTRGNVAFFGCLGYELDLKRLLPVEVEEIQAQIAFYKAYREVFQFGRFTRTETGWQVSDGETTIAGVFHAIVNAAPGYEWLRVPNLEKSTRYQVVSLSQNLRIGQFGSLLKHVAPVSIDPNGQLLRIADRHMTLPEGEEVLTVSGARHPPVPPVPGHGL